MNELLRAIYEEKINMSDLQLHQIAKDNGFDLYSQEYRVMIVSFPNRIDSPECYRRYCVELPGRFKRFFSGRSLRAVVTSDYLGKNVILLMEQMENARIQQLVCTLLDYLDAHSMPDAVIAVGERVPSIARVSYSYRTAVNALNYQSLYSGERCLFCEDMQAMMNLSTLMSVIHPDRMLQAFQSDNMDELRLLVTAYAEKVRVLSGDAIEGRHPTSIRRMFVELTVYVLHIASDMGVDVDLILNGMDPYNFLLANDKSTPMIIDWFMSMCSDLRGSIDEKARSKEQTIINKTCDYIDKNITRYDLSLDDTAIAVGMTASYLSKLFHKEMGIGFSKYIVHKRMKIALSLLTESNLTVKEISERAGFASANYFGTVFKREMGISPLNYRIQIAGTFDAARTKNQ